MNVVLLIWWSLKKKYYFSLENEKYKEKQKIGIHPLDNT